MSNYKDKNQDCVLDEIYKDNISLSSPLPSFSSSFLPMEEEWTWVRAWRSHLDKRRENRLSVPASESPKGFMGTAAWASHQACLCAEPQHMLLCREDLLRGPCFIPQGQGCTPGRETKLAISWDFRSLHGSFSPPLLSVFRVMPHKVKSDRNCSSSWETPVTSRKRGKFPETELGSLLFGRMMVYIPTYWHKGWGKRTKILKAVLRGTHSTAEGPGVEGVGWKTLQRVQTGWLTPCLDNYKRRNACSKTH